MRVWKVSFDFQFKIKMKIEKKNKILIFAPILIFES